MVSMICREQIQSKKQHVLDHADRTAPTRQHELEIMQIFPEKSNRCSLKYLDR